MTTPPPHTMAGPPDARGHHQQHWVAPGVEPEAHRLGTVYIAVCGTRCVPGPHWYLDLLDSCAECARCSPPEPVAPENA